MVALLKYEFKSTARTFLPLYGVMLTLSLILGVSSSRGASYSDIFSPLSFMQGVPFIVFFALSIAIMVITLLMTVQRFSENLLGEEGYLMFTLPVSCTSLILSKLIVAASWFVLSGLCLGLSVLIIAGGWYSAINSIADALRLLNPLFVENAALYLFEFMLSAVIQSASSVLMIYAAISIGHLSNKHRGMIGFFAFIALLVVQSTLSSLVLGVLFASPPSVATYAAYESAAAYAGIGLNTLWAVVYFLITNYILSSRLNLE